MPAAPDNQAPIDVPAEVHEDIVASVDFSEVELADEFTEQMCIRDSDKAEHTETEREVAQLEAAEDDVRKRTRDSRVKFTGAIVCIIAAILVIIAIWLFASK